jgi:hypothetical protein
MTRACLLATCSALLVGPAVFAEEKRELEAHEHGHGALNIAIEGDTIAMELEVPGFDIVGFEYEAKTDADKATVTAALDTLGDAGKLFGLPAAAGCQVVEASVELHGDEHHDDHDEHAHDEKHDDHAEDHAHDDTHENHAEEHGDHDDHAEEDSHSEFHAEYAFSCSDIGNLTTIALPYFETFENAEELEVQMVTDKGATLFEASRETPVLDLSKLM